MSCQRSRLARGVVVVVGGKRNAISETGSRAWMHPAASMLSSSVRRLSSSAGNEKLWFRREEILDPWSQQDLTPLEYPPLDTPTRHLIQLLQDLYYELPMFLDRPTIERCNRAIADLSDTARGGKDLAGRAQRADDILRTMELFWEKKREGEKVSVIEWPHPNRETYLGVLQLYAREKHSPGDEIPLRCRALVESMEERGGSLRPDALVWNQVLSAWASCGDEHKALAAANLLKQMQKKSKAGVVVVVDASSYSHVLRACAKSHTSPASKELGGNVALQVWRDFHEHQPKLKASSYLYSFFLQACAYIKDPAIRDSEAEVAFLECCGNGKVNNHVLMEFQKTASPSVFHNLIGKVTNTVTSQNASAQSIFAQLPYDWTENADQKTSWGW